MAKSRIALGLALALAAAAAPAAARQADGAGDAAAEQRARLRLQMRLDCPPAEYAGEIVVCGSREAEERRYRLPLTVARAPSAADRAGGEQRAALAADSSRCTTVGRDQQCTRGLDLIGIGFTVARAVAQALANRD